MLLGNTYQCLFYALARLYLIQELGSSCDVVSSHVAIQENPVVSGGKSGARKCAASADRRPHKTHWPVI